MAGPGRPRFDLGASRAGRPRRDPRADAAALLVGREPRPRLDRAHRGAPVAGERAGAAAPRIVTVDNPAFLVLVVADPGVGPLSAHDRQTLGAARLLSQEGGAVVLATERPLDEAGALGADRLVALPPLLHPERRAASVAALIEQLKPAHLVLPESPEGGDLARRLAAWSDEALFCGVEQISRRGLVRSVRSRGVDQAIAAPPRFLTVAPDMLAAYDGPEREARRIEPDLPPAADAPAEHLPAQAGGLPLAEADFVVSAGNGIVDFEAFRRLAAALGATAGASRVVCDAGLMPREAQVGASGTVLSASCYLALGIAGAPQHLQGIGTCEHVIAVNTDLHAAMVERAELAIVADAHPVMQALLRLLEEGR
ncbi:electron transfer flavoprotein subunit alpha/FixB family protein [Aureimonas populi]|uniref:Electron transfer flavoprotein subunit alpha/FixB family protein n=1 Tax=Aureimonas populi TaxID=1701758 RepID=A0ABW5CI23_9HYPH